MRMLIAVAALAAVAACSPEPAPAPDATIAEAPAPTVIVLTEADARTRLETDGYTNITGLVQNPDGSWSATGTRNGQATQVTVSDSGVQVTTTTPPATP